LRRASNRIDRLRLLLRLEAARRSKRLKRFVYLSSVTVYGLPKYVSIDGDHPKRPISPYDISKLTGELYAMVYHELYNVLTAFTRPFNVYGKNQDTNSSYPRVISRFVERIEKGLPLIVYGDGKQTRDFIHVSDVINMIILTIKCERAVGEAFNCGTGKEDPIES